MSENIQKSTVNTPQTGGTIKPDDELAFNNDIVLKIIEEYFETFSVNDNSKKIYVIANFNKSVGKTDTTFVIKGDSGCRECTSIEKKKVVKNVINNLFIKDMETVNSFIGFMSHLKDQVVIFKTKSIEVGSQDKKASSGRACDNRPGSYLIDRIHEILDFNKYKVKQRVSGRKSTNIISITDYKGVVHSEKDIKQIDDKKDVKINALQLCIEIELLLRYFDFTGYKGKRWFFNTVDYIINSNISG